MKNFKELLQRAKKRGPKRCIVAGGEDESTIQALVLAIDQGICYPVLIGDVKAINSLIDKLKLSRENFEIIAGDPGIDAIKEVKEKGDFLLKGKLSTPDFLRAVLAPEGLRTESILSHTAIMEIPGYHKLVFMSDGGMNINPDLDKKIAITKNVIDLAHRLGIDNPKIAVLSASETVDPKLQDSIDAQELTKMNQSGKITGAIIKGPLSLDLAMSKEAANKKGFDHPVCGDADILIVPDVATGNIFAKGLIYFAKAKAAGIVCGAKKPVVMLSRADPPEMKLLTITLGVLVS